MLSTENHGKMMLECDYNKRMAGRREQRKGKSYNIVEPFAITHHTVWKWWHQWHFLQVMQYLPIKSLRNGSQPGLHFINFLFKIKYLLILNYEYNSAHNYRCNTLVSFSGWFPVFGTYYRQADLALLIDVGVVNLCFECDFGGLEGIFCREYNLNPECSFVIWGVVLQQKNAP